MAQSCHMSGCGCISSCRNSRVCIIHIFCGVDTPPSRPAASLAIALRYEAVQPLLFQA